MISLITDIQEESLIYSTEKYGKLMLKDENSITQISKFEL